MMIPLEMLHDPVFAENGITVSVLRLDKLHPFISGNKWFKLKYNLQAFQHQKKKYLVTFGGAFSNHLVATAAAGKDLGIQTAGIVRGNELHTGSNPVLQFASGCGMKLFFVSREEYRRLREGSTTEELGALIHVRPDDVYLLPEGGSNDLAVKGCAEIVRCINDDFDFIACAVGTGATLAGITTSISSHQSVIGISVLEGSTFLEKEIIKLNGDRKNFKIFHDYSQGGYAKSPGTLIQFCSDFLQRHQMEIEPVYTGKLFLGLHDLAGKKFFKSGTRIVALHTGGIYPWTNAGISSS